jgi:AsmA protein
MKKSLKIAMIAVGILLALLVALVLILPSLINLDKVRSLAEEKATEALGREVVIDGVGFSLWKGPRVSLAGLSIAEHGDFGEKPFVQLGSFDLKVRFWPLLKKRVEVDHVILVDPRIRLVRNNKQVWNFQDILDHMDSVPTEKESKPEDDGESGPPVSFLARDIRVTGGEITLADATNDRLKNGISLMGISVKLIDISMDRPMAMEASAGIGRPEADLKFTGMVGPVGERPDPGAIPFDLSFELVSLDLTRLKNFGITVPLILDGSIAAKESVKGTLARGFDFEQRAEFSGISVTSAEGPMIRDLSGSLITKGFYELKTGALKLDRFDVKADRAVFKGSGTAKDLMGKPTLNLRLNSNPIPMDGWDRVFPAIGSIAKLAGDMTFAGTLKGTMGKNLAARMEFTSTNLEIDRGPGLGGKREEGKGTGDKGKAGPMKDPSINVSGKVSVAKGRLEKVSYTDLTATLSQKGTRFSLDDLSFRAFGGSLGGSAWADLGTAPMDYGSNLRTHRVQMNDVLSTFTGLKGILFGEVTSDISLNGRGFELAQLKKFLSGKGSIKIGAGRLTNTNILGEAGQTASMLGLTSQEKETTFDGMDASFSIGRGKVNFSGMQILTRKWGLTGSGDVGMDQSLAMTARMALSDALARNIPRDAQKLFPRDGQGRLQIPLKISGTVTSPKFDLDSRVMGKVAEERVKKEVKKKQEELEDKFQEKIEKELGDILKKLF